MEEKVREKYLEAGKIAKKAKKKAVSMVKPGNNFEKVAEAAEKVIRDEGAETAFPVNISINEQAAHYTPEKQDKKTFSKGDLVKIDVGAQIDGYIGDTAETVDLGNHEKLVKAAVEAVESNLEIASDGTELGNLGEKAENAIKERGFKPVKNLGGHSLEQYNLHAGTMLPCIKTTSANNLEKGKAYAVECFATNGEGKVLEGGAGNIYKYEGGSTRDRTARKIIKLVKSKYRGLPFTTRWINQSKARTKLAMGQMVRKGVMKEYGVLKEQSGGQVSQHEHTIIVTEEGAEITTK